MFDLEPRVPPPFVLGVAEQDGASVVVVGGELDLHTAGELDETLARLDGRRIVVDLREVTFLDSTALAVLLAAARRRAGKRLGVDLVLGPGDVRRVFQITGLDQRFRFFETVEEALAR
jgi:anti-sigma B factor antagonist